MSALRSAAGSLIDKLPEALRLRVLGSRAGYRASDVPPPVVPPSTPVRLYIAPANSAGQGYAWARAAERIPGVGAVDMQILRRDDFGYATDEGVPQPIVVHSARWGRAQFAAVADGFTHVLAESHVALFGKRFDADVRAERRALAAAGVAVAALSHGSDIRSPDRHRDREPDSPFHHVDRALTVSLTASTRRRRALLDEIDGVEFVSTPDLLLDRPRATWLPVVVDPARWATRPLELERGDVPTVVHAPSLAGLKGTELVLPVLRTEADAGRVDLRMPERVRASQMTTLIRESDIVLDQFSLGIYGVAACEAMAAGRLVVSHVSDFVRETVRDQTGWDLPIVQARADELAAVLDDIRDRPEHYREIAAQGPRFVAEVHDGARSARTLRPFLTGSRG